MANTLQNFSSYQSITFNPDKQSSCNLYSFVKVCLYSGMHNWNDFVREKNQNRISFHCKTYKKCLFHCYYLLFSHFTNANIVNIAARQMCGNEWFSHRLLNFTIRFLWDLLLPTMCLSCCITDYKWYCYHVCSLRTNEKFQCDIAIYTKISKKKTQGLNGVTFVLSGNKFNHILCLQI